MTFPSVDFLAEEDQKQHKENCQTSNKTEYEYRDPHHWLPPLYSSSSSSSNHAQRNIVLVQIQGTTSRKGVLNGQLAWIVDYHMPTGRYWVQLTKPLPVDNDKDKNDDKNVDKTTKPTSSNPPIALRPEHLQRASWMQSLIAQVQLVYYSNDNDTTGTDNTKQANQPTNKSLRILAVCGMVFLVLLVCLLVGSSSNGYSLVSFQSVTWTQLVATMTLGALLVRWLLPLVLVDDNHNDDNNNDHKDHSTLASRLWQSWHDMVQELVPAGPHDMFHTTTGSVVVLLVTLGYFAAVYTSTSL